MSKEGHDKRRRSYQNHVGNSNESPSFDITQIDLPHHLNETERKTKTLEYAEKMASYFNLSQNSEGFDDAETCRTCQGGNLVNM